MDKLSKFLEEWAAKGLRNGLRPIARKCFFIFAKTWISLTAAYLLIVTVAVTLNEQPSLI